jgi:hypothetical protein
VVPCTARRVALGHLEDLLDTESARCRLCVQALQLAGGIGEPLAVAWTVREPVDERVAGADTGSCCRLGAITSGSLAAVVGDQARVGRSSPGVNAHARVMNERYRWLTPSRLGCGTRWRASPVSRCFSLDRVRSLHYRRRRTAIDRELTSRRLRGRRASASGAVASSTRQRCPSAGAMVKVIGS